MEPQTIIIISLLIIIVLIVLYYTCYAENFEEDVVDIPFDLLGRYKTSITELFQAVSQKYPKYVALKQKINNSWKNITYRDYYSLCDAFAQRLLYYVGPHPRVGIISKNCPEWFYAHLGTMIANGASVGINPSWDAATYQHIINVTHIDVVVVENHDHAIKLLNADILPVKLILVIEQKDIDAIKNKFQEKTNKINMVSFDEFVSLPVCSTGISTSIEISLPESADVATIIYDKTKGSTAMPQGIVITHNNIMNSIWNGLHVIKSRSNINICTKERYISYLPLNNVSMQLLDCYVPIASVGTVHFTNKKHIYDTIQETRPSVILGNSKLWETLMKIIATRSNANLSGIFNQLIGNKLLLEELGLDHIKFCITIDPATSHDILIFYKNIGIDICKIYGMNETTGPISMCVPGWTKGVGIPLLDIKIDQDTSEIYVKGNNVFQEYYKNKKATKKAFAANSWFKTGTIGYIDRDGSLFVTEKLNKY